jgi:CRISPR-associated protein Cas1
MEGARVKKAYADASKEYGVRWSGRQYNRGAWGDADPINRALSSANALLNGICHAAIVSGGYSPALGFIHTGRQLSFVYDIADLYKAEITIPISFKTVAEDLQNVEKRTRVACREKMREVKLLQRILPDIDSLLECEVASEESPPLNYGRSCFNGCSYIRKSSGSLKRRIDQMVDRSKNRRLRRSCLCTGEG